MGSGAGMKKRKVLRGSFLRGIIGCIVLYIVWDIVDEWYDMIRYGMFPLAGYQSDDGR